MEYFVQNTNCGSKRFVLSCVETTLTVEVAEQFIRVVDDMNDQMLVLA